MNNSSLLEALGKFGPEGSRIICGNNPVLVPRAIPYVQDGGFVGGMGPWSRGHVGGEKI